MVHTQGRRLVVKTTSATTEASSLFDRQSEKMRLVDNVSRLRGKKSTSAMARWHLLEWRP